MKRLLMTLVLLGAVGPPALAQSFYVAADVPTDLGGVTYLPWQVIRKDNPGPYSLALTLPFLTPIDGLHRMDAGDWLISVEAPTDLGGVTYDPRDVIRTNGAVFANFFCGSSPAIGVPLGSNLDALFTNGGDAGDLIVSFDIPTTIGAVTYDPADLLQYMRTGPLCSNWAFVGLAFDASATAPPIPITTNVTGADMRGALTILSFDVPTTLGATTYMPGDLVSWNGVAFALSFSGAANGWPVSSIDDFAFLADPGVVPVTMTVNPGPGFPADMTLTWSTSCSAGAENYGIYEGTLGTWYSHTAFDCNDAFPFLTEDVPVPATDTYYLVVPFSPNDEGSYGRDSSTIERPVGAARCRIPQVISPCP